MEKGRSVHAWRGHKDVATPVRCSGRRPDLFLGFNERLGNGECLQIEFLLGQDKKRVFALCAHGRGRGERRHGMVREGKGRRKGDKRATKVLIPRDERGMHITEEHRAMSSKQ